MDPQDKEYLRDLAGMIKARLPDGYVFILLATSIGEGGRTVYTSNARREDAINLLKEWLIKASGPEEWMKHIK